MGQFWGETAGHRSCLTTHRLATRLRLVRVGDTATVRKLLATMEGENRGETVFQPDEALTAVWALRRAANRMWWTPRWARLARIIANDAARLGNAGRAWTVD